MPPALTYEEAQTIVCFVRGTLIKTIAGIRPIENLRKDEVIITKDNSEQPIRWIGSRTLTKTELRAAPWLCPVGISAGSLAPDAPSSDLLVSPQHRVLIRSKIAQNMFGTMEVLVAAKQICAIEGMDDMDEVEYFHMLFDQHEIVLSNDAETESLYTGPQALKSVGAKALKEIHEIFSGLQDPDNEPSSARMLIPGRKARKLTERHVRNGKQLQCTMH